MRNFIRKVCLTKATKLTIAVVTFISMGAAYAHHSFAMFNIDQTFVYTGVVTNINPDSNHLEIFYVPMNVTRDGVIRDDNGDPVIWSLEMSTAPSAAKFGITVDNFKPGTIFSGAIHPGRKDVTVGLQVRNNKNQMVLYKCPGRTTPAKSMHCDSVEGATEHGTGPLPEATGPSPYEEI